MIGGRRPISGRKPGDKRIRVERHHAPYFRYTGPGQLTAKAAASAPTTPARPVIRSRIEGRRCSAGRWPTRRRSASACPRRRRSRSSAPTRSRRPPTRPRRSSSRSSSPASRGAAFACRDPGQHRDRRPARDRRLQLPPGVHRLPHRRRLVLGVQGEPRPARVAGRGLGAAHRLHADRRRVDVVRRGADRLGRVPALDPVRVEIGAPRDRADHARQPPRPARGRQHLRDPDLPVPRLGVPDDRAWASYRILFLGDTGPAPTPEVVAATHQTAIETSAILILLRAFASGAVALTGHRGDRDRRARVQAARSRGTPPGR